MSQCICGRFYSVSYARTDDKNFLDMCPECYKASSSGGYLSSKEWVCGNISGSVYSDHEEYQEDT